MKIILNIFIALIFISSCNKNDIAEKKIVQEVSLDSSSSQVVLLGTGTPNATPERSGPAVAIIVRNNSYIVDCGPGIVRRASGANINALKVENLIHLFITHLHSDHTLGLADFIFTPWVLGREDSIKIFGPVGIKSMVSHITQAYQQDIKVRLSGLQPSTRDGYKAFVSEFKQGLVFQDSNVSVYAYKVDHGDWGEAYAFRIVTFDKVITVSGDCKPCQGIIDASEGCDILIHEVYSYKGFLKRKPEWQKYHKASHTSSFELAALANKVKPKKLILYHILNWGATDDELVGEVKRYYEGNVICGKDLDIIY